MAGPSGIPLRFLVPAPANPATLVARPRLDGRLSRGVERPVTLVVAGPGSGKTLTVASWAGREPRSPGAVAWLTVDATDNDLATAWSDVLDALRIGGALPDGSPLRGIVPGAAFGAVELRDIRFGLADLPAPVVLVLDDFQAITNPVVLESFDQLIDRSPPHLRLVIATRADPRLRLHRLRVNGELAEIRSRDLAFTAPETAELFDRSGLRLSDRQVQALLTRTEGWSAGLRLASMSLDPNDIDRGIARFSGTEGSVAEYLIGEVVDRLPEDHRNFLLRTSIVRRLTVDLATELSGRVDGELILEKLIGANAFVVAFGERRDWFGYHPLFREMLAHRLALEQPAAVRDLHLRAARWFAAHGQPVEGIRHAIDAGDLDEVGRLMIAATPLMLTPDRSALVAALDPVAARAVQHPGWCTLLAATICHFRRGDYEAMRLDADEAGQFLTAAPADVRPGAEIVLATSRMVDARFHDSATLVPAAAHVLHLVDQAPRSSLSSGRHFRVMATNNLAVGQLWAGDFAAAESSLFAAQAHSRELVMGLAELNAHVHLALLDLLHGRLRSAHRQASDAQQSLDSHGWGSEIQALPAYLTLGLIHLAQNQPELADNQIGRGLAASSRVNDQAGRLALGIAAVNVAVLRGDTDGLRAAVARLRDERATAGDLPTMLADWCATAQAEAHVVAGAPAEAIELSAAIAADRGGLSGARASVVLARAWLALGEPGTALQLLEPLRQSALPYLVEAVDARVLAAVALGRRHRTTAALEAITEAIELAEPETLIAPFVRAGSAVTEMIVQYRHVTGVRHDFADVIQHAITPQPVPEPALPNHAVEQLTDRETLVLRYLPTMLKSSEIGADLYLSVNTVKSHLRSIYRKLDVTNRRDAVERARALNLI